MPDNLFSLSGATVNPAPNLPPPGALARTSELPAPASLDASGMMERWANIQNIRNQNTLFQQTFAARQRAGQILSAAPDTQTAIKALQADPQTSAFAPEIAATTVGTYQSLTSTQGEIQRQGQSGFEAFVKMTPLIMAQPSKFDAIAQGQLALVPPGARAQAALAIDSLKKTIFEPYVDAMASAKSPTEVQAAKTQMVRNIAGMGLAAGIPPDSLGGGLWGQQGNLPTGSGTESGVFAPAWAGGGFHPQSFTPMEPGPERKTLPFGPGGAQTEFSISGNTATPVTVGGGEAPANSMTPSFNALAGFDPAKAVAAAGGNPDAAIQATANQKDGDQKAQAIADYESNQLRGSKPSTLTGPSQQQGEANLASGRVVGDIVTDMTNNARDLPNVINRFNVMEKALGHFQAGGLAAARGSAAQFLQGLRDGGLSIPDSTIQKVGNASLADTQVFEANIKPLVIRQLKESAQGTGRVMRSEVDAFMAMMSTETDPHALMTLLNEAKYATQVGYAQSSLWPKFRQGVESGQITNYQLPDFYQYFNDHQKMTSMPAKTGGGLALGPGHLTPAGNDQAALTAKVLQDYRLYKSSGGKKGVSRDQAKVLLQQFGHQ